MFKFATKLFGLALVVAATAGVALAQDASGGTTTGGDIPEIDPGSVASALTLLCGGALMLTDKIRRK